MKTLYFCIIKLAIAAYVSSLMLCSCHMFINDDTSYLRHRRQRYMELLKQNIDSLKQLVDSAEIKYYIDKKYNVKLFYPDFINMADTSKAGLATFKYMSYYSPVYFEQSIDTNLFKTNVEIAVNYQIYISDSTAKCLDRGKDWYIIKGRSFVRKSFLIDKNWFEYTLSYGGGCEEVIGRLINLLKEWDPREER